MFLNLKLKALCKWFCFAFCMHKKYCCVYYLKGLMFGSWNIVGNKYEEDILRDV